MSTPVTDLLGAAQLLTRAPIHLRTAPDIGASAPWFPVVGAGVGLVVAGAAAGLIEVGPAGVAASVAVLLGVLLTGAFHEDGLADTADAMGGWTPEQRREILKDSRHGSYGVAALCGSIVIRVASVATFGPAVAFGGLVAAHALGRAAAVGVMAFATPTPMDGLGSDSIRSMSRPKAMVGICAGVAIGALATGWWIGPLILGVGVGAVGVTLVASRALGGVSGDVLGAVEQVGECASLVIVSTLALHHQPWWT